MAAASASAGAGRSPRAPGAVALPLADVYGLLEPGPVVLLGTARHGRPNLMAMSWHLMLEFEPPLVGCVVSSRNFSAAALKATRQAVINVPTVELAMAVVGCGNCSGREVDKFAAFGLTALPSAQIDVPRVAECFAQLECRLVDRVRRYEMFVLEVVGAWADPAAGNPRTLHHRGWGAFAVAGRTLRLPSQMR